MKPIGLFAASLLLLVPASTEGTESLLALSSSLPARGTRPRGGVISGIFHQSRQQLAAAVEDRSQSTLECYPHVTQIGVGARRIVRDEHGWVAKEIFYRTPTMADPGTCSEGPLVVYQTVQYQRDGLGRTIVETVVNPQGTIDHVVRYEYQDASNQWSRHVTFGPGGDRRFEMRRGGQRPSWLYFNERGRVVAIMFAPSADVDYDLAWESSIDGWQCGVGFARGSYYLNLRNLTPSDVSAVFGDTHETELRDANGSIVPMLPEVALRLAGGSTEGASGRYIMSGEVGSQSYTLNARYGSLPRGHYSLIIRYPHPTKAAMVNSGQIEFDIP